MGTLIQSRGLDEATFRGTRFTHHDARPLLGHFDLLALTQPDIVTEVHNQYLAAGSDIITTNTFMANAIAQAHHQLQSLVPELNHVAARLARAAADRWSTPERTRFVAGALGPTPHSLSREPQAAADRGDAPAATWDQMRAAYREQADALLEGGVDLLLVETVVDLRNLAACLSAIESVFADRGRRVPLLVSAVIQASGGTGELVDAFAALVAPARPLAIGVNCVDASALRPALAALADRLPDCRRLAYPSAGLPDALGRHPETPATIANALGDLARAGLVHIVGGCCGTTPQHIRAIAATLKEEASHP